jgi:hypothetical protein
MVLANISDLSLVEILGCLDVLLGRQHKLRQEADAELSIRQWVIYNTVALYSFCFRGLEQNCLSNETIDNCLISAQ